MKILFSIFLSFTCLTPVKAQQSLDTIKPAGRYENIYNRPVFSDSLASSFVIFIKKEVKAHKHETHAEQVMVLEGTGEMTLGEKSFTIRKGDFILIPKNTFHSVKTTSKVPLKVLSVQAPFFDGKDRIYKDQQK